MKIVGLIVALVATVSPPVLAGTPTDEVRQILAETNRILTDPATEDQIIERLHGVLELIDRVFAFDEAAKLALGREWDARTAAERVEFLVGFADFVERSFLMTAVSIADLRAVGEMRYRKESVKKGVATVQTTTVARDDGEVRVEFSMVERDNRWRIRDVVLEGESLALSYRAHFNRILRTASFPDLIARMKARAIDVPDWWSAARLRNFPPPAPVTTQPQRAVVSVAEPTPDVVTRSAGGSAANETAGSSSSRDLPRLPEPTAAPAPASPSALTAPSPSVLTPPGSLLLAAPSPSALTASSPSGPAAPGPSVPTAIAPAPPADDRQPSGVAEAGTVAAPTPVSTEYWIAIGLFGDPNAASRVAESLLKRALPVEIGPVDVKARQPDVRWTRVRVGPFTDGSAAAATLRDLERRGYSPFLVTESSTAPATRP